MSVNSGCIEKVFGSLSQASVDAAIDLGDFGSFLSKSLSLPEIVPNAEEPEFDGRFNEELLEQIASAQQTRDTVEELDDEVLEIMEELAAINEKLKKELHAKHEELERVYGVNDRLNEEFVLVRQEMEDADALRSENQEKQIQGLQEELKEAREDVDFLAEENSRLCEELDKAKADAQKREEEMKALRKKAEEYEALVAGMNAKREQFARKMETAVKHFKEKAERFN
ncbi:hypothetical protein L596_015897 [Steinernema carpocapsae]|uniref:Transforming acidic coiled-coil-containing protein C-terminal domain-containing protein n=1 Tax=Steinernema carpocapsae TaxID=34508 RepID=A0A4U5NGZ2_STECR|nr:hypothetical protein L596_015897 [Steinernema carpocapsae]